MSNSTALPLSLKCFPDSSLILMSELEKRISHFIFPVQFTITVIGNLLTMSVLLSGHMKNRANHLLAFLALCDIMVFVMMFPHYLSSLDLFADRVDFRVFHFHTKVHFAALSNWFSAAAIWFVLAVSIERLLIIKYPFRSLDGYNVRHVIIVSMGIFVTTLALTSFHHLSHTCMSWVVCNGTQAVGTCYSNLLESFGRRINPTSELTKQWIATSVYLNAAFAVLLPIMAVAVINISLIRLLKKRNNEELMMHSVSVNASSLHEQERKMTNTVLAIVSCFTLTQGPSALVYSFQRLFATAPLMRDLSILANQLVLTGKMLNVILFCLTSETFRRKMMNTCRCWMLMMIYCDQKQGRSRFSRDKSKSVITQKTSIMYSPSARNFSARRVSALSDNISMKAKKETQQSLLMTDRSDNTMDTTRI